MKIYQAVMFAAVSLAASLGTARADDPLLVTFTPGTLIGHPGDTLTLNGILANQTSAALFLTGDQPTINTSEDFTLDDLNFFLSAPPSFEPMGDPGGLDMFSGDLLDITIGGTVPNGTYSGTINYVGGSGQFSTDIIGTQEFRVVVVPEPGALALLTAGGVLGVGLTFRRYRRR